MLDNGSVGADSGHEVDPLLESLVPASSVRKRSQHVQSELITNLPSEENNVRGLHRHPSHQTERRSATEGNWLEHFIRGSFPIRVGAVSREGCISSILPFWSWFKVYPWNDHFGSDVIAGLTVGVMIIPQSMSYAKLAGLPVQYGLYSSLTPVVAYVLWGTSRQLAIGPVALISLMLASGLSKILASEGLSPESSDYPAAYNTLAIQCSLLVGLVYLIAGLCRLGFVTVFLSHPVISGFTTGAATIIGMSQIKYIFGFDIAKSERLQDIIFHLRLGIDKFNYKTFLMGSLSVGFLTLVKKAGSLPIEYKHVGALGPLLLTILAVTLTSVLNLDQNGIPVVGNIPRGFPKLTVGDWTAMPNFGELVSVVIGLAVIGFMESIAIAKQLASKHGYEIDASKELIGLGMANLLGSAFNAFPVAGSFSRTAVNNASGAKSGLSGMVTAMTVCLALFCLTPVFEKLPLNSLAAIVISGVSGLLDFGEAFHLWKVDKLDFSIWCIACVSTMFAGCELGLGIAVSASLLMVVYECAHPKVVQLGRLPGTNVYTSIEQYPDAEIHNGISIVRIGGPLYFATAQNVEQSLRTMKARNSLDAQAGDGNTKYIILDMSCVWFIDSTFLLQLKHLVVNFRLNDIEFCFVDTPNRVMRHITVSGLDTTIGLQCFFDTLCDAVSFCLSDLSIQPTEPGLENENFAQFVSSSTGGHSHSLEPANV